MAKSNKPTVAENVELAVVEEPIEVQVAEEKVEEATEPKVAEKVKEKTAVVTADLLNVREEAVEGSTILGTLKAGQTIKLLDGGNAVFAHIEFVIKPNEIVEAYVMREFIEEK